MVNFLFAFFNFMSNSINDKCIAAITYNFNEGIITTCEVTKAQFY